MHSPSTDAPTGHGSALDVELHAHVLCFVIHKSRQSNASGAQGCRLHANAGCLAHTDTYDRPRPEEMNANGRWNLSQGASCSLLLQCGYRDVSRSRHVQRSLPQRESSMCFRNGLPQLAMARSSACVARVKREQGIEGWQREQKGHAQRAQKGQVIREGHPHLARRKQRPPSTIKST